MKKKLLLIFSLFLMSNPPLFAESIKEKDLTIKYDYLKSDFGKDWEFILSKFSEFCSEDYSKLKTINLRKKKWILKCVENSLVDAYESKGLYDKYRQLIAQATTLSNLGEHSKSKYELDKAIKLLRQPITNNKVDPSIINDYLLTALWMRSQTKLYLRDQKGFCADITEAYNRVKGRKKEYDELKKPNSPTIYDRIIETYSLMNVKKYCWK